MQTTTSPTTESASPLRLYSHRFWCWMALNLLTAVFYLLPISGPGKGILLLLGLAAFWVGVSAAFWPYRWLRLVPITVALLSFYPVRTGTTRLLLLCGLVALWMIALVIFRQRRNVLMTLLAGAGLITAVAFLPGRMTDPAGLRAEYVRSLQDFKGTAYIWGGENAIGIDCSGLIRCGWMDANLRIGLRTLNPHLIRQAARIWWQDCSAQELSAGYRDRTRFAGMTTAINRLDYAYLQTGDVVVTESGVHTLAYLGDRNWIEADPRAGAVITLQAPVAGNPWFEEPIKIIRWREEE